MRAPLLAILLAAPAAAQFPVSDLGVLSQTLRLTAEAQKQLEQARAFRQQLDAQVAAVATPFAQLHLAAGDLATSTIALPGSLGTPRALGAAIQARLNNAGAGYATVAAPSAAQVRAAVTDTAAGDPLHPTPGGARATRDAAAATAAQTAAGAALADAHGRLATETRALGTALNVLQRTGTAGAALEGLPDGSWTAWSARQTAALHTVGNLQAKALELQAAELARRIAERQDALRESARQRLAMLGAAARSKARFAAYMGTARDDGDDLFEACAARLFTAGCAAP